jgi:hypothetical protein
MGVPAGVQVSSARDEDVGTGSRRALRLLGSPNLAIDGVDRFADRESLELDGLERFRKEPHGTIISLNTVSCYS